MPRKRPKTGPDNIKYVEDTAKALDLKRVGLTIRQIGVAIGRSDGWVHGAIAKYVDTHAAPHLAAYRAEVLDRQAGIIAAHWAQRANPASAKVIQESDRIIISIMGLEARREVDITGAVAISDGAHEQLISGLASLAARISTGESDPEPQT
jgi:hypothetical protein